MLESPEKSKRKGKPDQPLSPNERRTLIFLLACMVTGIVILALYAYLIIQPPRDTPFELTSTAISLTNFQPVILLTITDLPPSDFELTTASLVETWNTGVARLLTATAEAARR